MKCESLLKREVSCLFSSILDLDKASNLNKYQRFVSLFVWFAMCDWVIVIGPSFALQPSCPLNSGIYARILKSNRWGLCV